MISFPLPSRLLSLLKSALVHLAEFAVLGIESLLAACLMRGHASLLFKNCSEYHADMGGYVGGLPFPQFLCTSILPNTAMRSMPASVSIVLHNLPSFFEQLPSPPYAAQL